MKSYASSAHGILHITILVGILGAIVLVLSRHPEALLLTAAPLAGLMLLNYRAAAVVTTWVLLVWFSRLAVVFYDFVLFSYVVYACICLTAVAYALRVVAPGRSRLRPMTNPWIWLLIGALIVAGIRGAGNVNGIPLWLHAGDVDYSIPWVYIRTVVLPAIFLPMLAIFIAAAVEDGETLTRYIVPMCAFVWAIGLLIVGEVALSGQSLLAMAQADEQRNEHLAAVGFHSNEFGTMLAIAYALLLGIRDAVPGRRAKAAISLTLALTVTALLLTFSRGAYLAFAVTNVLFFMRATPRRKAAFVTLVVIAFLAAPAAVADRAQYALDSRDPNAISAGRVENIWMPLLPDVKEHLLLGQGLESIMWTEAQRLELIFPVSLAHNAYLDLLLDFGLAGSLPILAWYAYLWRGFLRQAKHDEDERFRRFFYGGHLALVSLAVSAITNDRLTPTATTVFLWIAAGVLMGRQALHTTRRSQLPASLEETRPRWFRMNGVSPRGAVPVN
jgi:O-antigen ligase